MKKFEIMVSGAYEEEVSLEIMQGIYVAIKNHGYTDVSVNANTIEESNNKELQIPEFLRYPVKGVRRRRV